MNDRIKYIIKMESNKNREKSEKCHNANFLKMLVKVYCLLSMKW